MGELENRSIVERTVDLRERSRLIRLGMKFIFINRSLRWKYRT